MKKNKHNIETGSSIERSDERIKETQEVFTPMDLVESMVNDIPEEMLKDPTSTFLDNSAGSGNFIIALKNKLCQYHSEEHVVNHMLYAVELMEDNHKELCERVGVSTDHPHYVCADALEYDYSFGELIGIEKFF
jgi:methylase of polypeptide subunit release factors